MNRYPLFLSLLFLFSGFPPLHAQQYWPQFRGPLGTGVAPNADPPVEWSETKNVRWKTALPGLGHSSPIVWGNFVFLTTAIPFGAAQPAKDEHVRGAHDYVPMLQKQKFAVVAFNRANGKMLWQKNVHEALPHEAGHNTGSFASPSPVTDGEHVFAWFGSNGLYCLDFQGKIVWQKDFGEMRTKHAHGEGSSPALYEKTIIVNWDHEAQSFVVALDKNTGAERWKVLRDEVTSWATPIVVEQDGKAQVIVTGTKRVRGYDLRTGGVVWEAGGMSANIVASPVAADGVVFTGSSYEKRVLLAIRLQGARGDVTGTKNMLWTRANSTPYVPSPLLYGDHLYYLRHYQGVLSRVNIKTGEDDGGPFRLNGIRNVYASLAAAAGRIYVTDRSGSTIVVSAEREPEVLGFNRLEDRFSATMAIVDGEIFLRGEKYLYCLAEK